MALMLFFLLLKLTLLLAAASCAATRGRGIAAAPPRSSVHGCWAAVASRTYAFFLLCFFFGLPGWRTSPRPSSISEASPAGFCLPLAQVHLNLGGKATHLFQRKESKFVKIYILEHSTTKKERV